MIRNKLIGIIGLIFVLLFISCVSLSSIEFPSKTTPATSAPLQTQKVSGEIAVIDLSTQQNIFAELYEKVDPGVVAIRVLSKEGQGLGSGFVIDKEGHIITNYHVVRSAKELEIDFPSGYKTRAEILGTDSDSDIAVLKVEAPSDELFPIPLGDSDAARVGQIVIAIGNPRGLDSTMTTGIISAKGRTMSSLHEAPGGGSFTAGGIIQTDAAINPGNSGGPLLNLNGDVIGVNVAIQTTSFDITGQPINSGIGFAVPINIVKRVVPALIKEGKYDYPYLGIRTLDEITLIQQEALGLPQASGVYVIDVTPDSPADRAGLRGGKTNTKIANLLGGGDLITAINNFPVRDFNDLITYLIHNKQPGDNVTLTVLRDKEQINLNLTLGKRP